MKNHGRDCGECERVDDAEARHEYLARIWGQECNKMHDYTQANNIGRPGDNIFSALIEDHKKLKADLDEVRRAAGETLLDRVQGLGLAQVVGKLRGDYEDLRRENQELREEEDRARTLRMHDHSENERLEEEARGREAYIKNQEDQYRVACTENDRLMGAKSLSEAYIKRLENDLRRVSAERDAAQTMAAPNEATDLRLKDLEAAHIRSCIERHALQKQLRDLKERLAGLLSYAQRRLVQAHGSLGEGNREYARVELERVLSEMQRECER